MIKMRVIGIASARTTLRNMAQRVTDAARSQMLRSADRIVAEAKINVPEDDEFLKESIRIERRYGTRNRLQIEIIAGAMEVWDKDGRLRNLDDYAALVHEDYEGSVANVHGPGPRTQRKMQMYPGRVGSKFLERASAAEQPRLERHIIRATSSIVGEMD